MNLKALIAFCFIWTSLTSLQAGDSDSIKIASDSPLDLTLEEENAAKTSVAAATV